MIKIRETNLHTVLSINLEIIGIGRRMAISTSKIKKIIAIIKNRKEKGIREFEKGSNPHSNGEDFSRSINVFFLTVLAIIIIIKAKPRIIVKIKNKVSIVLSGVSELFIGSEIYFLY